MLSFFRKVRKKLIDTGNLRNYLFYSFGEVLLIIIGVLLAVQINTAFQKRNDIKKENLLLKEIHEEFVANRAQLENIMEANQRRVDICTKIIELFPIDTKTDDYSILSQLLISIGRNTFNPSQGTIDAIIGTSSLDIIRNNELRELLIKWEGEISDFKEQESNVINHLNNQYEPFLIKFLPFPAKVGDPLNLEDTRLDLSIIESIEFENHVKSRRGKLFSLIKGHENMDRISEIIDQVLELTQEYK